MSVRLKRDLPILSAILVIINIIVFLICTFTGNLLYNMGRLDVQNVLVAGEYGRIIYAMFLHSDFNHLFNNMVILFFLGSMIEKEIGHVLYGIIYFFSGICGNLLSLIGKLLTGSGTGTVGASGGIFGLDGVLLALILFSGKSMPNITPVRVLLMIGLSLYSGYTGGNVDNAAHIGGLIAGFLGGMLFCLISKRGRKSPWEQNIERYRE